VTLAMEIWLVRHGATLWSASGQHTGRTDLPLTPEGETAARGIGDLLKGRQFAVVLSSPMQRALETCRIAGYGEQAVVDENLREWDYGDYEGRTSREIQSERPGWSLWKDGVRGGESIGQVAARAEAVMERALGSGGDALLFAHGHILRILSARWLGLPAEGGRYFALGTAAVSRLGYEHDARVITAWNCGGRAK
jgi:broad specificity phosphatase PhoE